MINSIFFINSQGVIILEKHWKKVIPRSICDYFFAAQRDACEDNIAPVIPTPHHYLFHITSNNISLLAVTVQEVPPLFVIEFLYRIVETLSDYLEEFSEKSLESNCVTVYEVLDEMLDNGFPLATELNVLKELIKPPTVLRKLASSVMGKSNVSATLPVGQLTAIPWRRTGVRYANNECFFDVVEEVNAIFDKTGYLISADIQGYIDALVKLSGMPDMTMTFTNPRVIDDISFHPCVRFAKWEKEKYVSFVPPDGSFRLLSYSVTAQSSITLPISIKAQIGFQTGSKVDITLIPRKIMGKPLEKVTLDVTLPRCVQNVTVTPSSGKVTFDPHTRQLNWNIGKIELDKNATLKGSIFSHSGVNEAECRPTINVGFEIPQVTVSGLRVNKMELYNEKYKPFKGVKYLTKAGHYQMRT